MHGDGESTIEISQASDADDVDVVRRLFLEYQEALGVDLDFQDFASEVAGLPGDYAPPRGRLLVARDGDEAAGCVAMRPLDGDVCEMKRLYVRPDYRSAGVGRRLAERVIDEARAAGYRRMYLDTLPTMAGAQRLYERLGFRDIAPYRHNPIAGTRYLGLEI
jgi:ribosomal protein S18 acetylase RimI-like enzyme